MSRKRKNEYAIGKDADVDPACGTTADLSERLDDGLDADVDEDSAAADMPDKSLDTYCKHCGRWLMATAASFLVFALFAPRLWLGMIFVFLIGVTVSMAAEALVNIYMVAFVDKGKTIPVARVKVLRWIASTVISVPFLFSAYGCAKGALEVMLSKHGKDSTVMVNMLKYETTCAEMNWLSRFGYRWAYHLLLDFKDSEGDGSLLDSFLSKEHTDDDEMSDDDLAAGIRMDMAADDFDSARQRALRIKDFRLKNHELTIIQRAEKAARELKDAGNEVKTLEDAEAQSDDPSESFYQSGL